MNKPTLKARKKMSEAHKGLKHTEESKRKISEANRGKNHPLWGKHHSEKTRRKMRESRSGEGNAMFGKHHSEETKRKISEANKGKLHRWEGGKIINSGGYVLIWKPDHPFSNKQGYVYEHRLVMEKMLGRYLKPKEIPHHKNEICDDNRPDNLQLFSSNYK
ncbi:unnamed protein product, partial [marine sediment metagenome]